MMLFHTERSCNHHIERVKRVLLSHSFRARSTVLFI